MDHARAAVLLVMAHGLKGGWMPSFKASLGVQAGNGIYLTLSRPRSVAWRERLSGGALVAVGASIAA